MISHYLNFELWQIEYMLFGEKSTVLFSETYKRIRLTFGFIEIVFKNKKTPIIFLKKVYYFRMRH